MSLVLEIPSAVAQSLRLPAQQQERQLLIELAVALYAQDVLSFGKARELAGMEKLEFGQLLGQRGVPRHYAEDDLAADLDYADSQ